MLSTTIVLTEFTSLNNVATASIADTAATGQTLKAGYASERVGDNPVPPLAEI